MADVKIGFEVHVQLDTRTKLFCDCPTDYEDAEPNENTCPVCTGMPGAKPLPPNEEALLIALEIAHMLDCEPVLDRPLYFQRKHYDYPDLPSGYQRTSVPIAVNGELDGVRIREIHVEEDPGRWEPSTGRVDYNRSGVPLIEIVTEPDMRSPEEARDFLRRLMQVLRYSGKVKGDGGIRVDANVSVEGGARVEIKNINSIKGVYRALRFEIQRQLNLMKHGREVRRETRAFREDQGTTVAMRSKETAEDYRYIPDPDIPVFEITEDLWEKAVARAPEPPHHRARRMAEEYGISLEAAEALVTEREWADFFEEVVEKAPDDWDIEFIDQWVRKEIKKILNKKEMTFREAKITPEEFIELLELVREDKITRQNALNALWEAVDSDKSPVEIIEENGLLKVSDEDRLARVVEEVIEENPQAVEDYKSGKEEAIHYLMGQVMRKTRGQADPEVTMRLLRERLDSDG
ncbi:Asp-tRNA(Asn)/Glu-tRNA(Gln) amidotransferase subunit GatB [Methanopyrus kandleri]|uniref:Aspartyl/glutamyl-tRNA(Asn/Gln) amidotransferase subunit B n=1 Tax=Methanopyrus kandleri (strain AV19 / DSM 6324 / JCM 9639 / NBRC 100938) TaxID=190192 RepID=GATB_METKA|nr:Asp-tRNA(Asn)/Glu-tRNA(Gln) amidotransferase subunit GatB [Methanopyrus kandleri]Q8TWS2.1 RecName: Full=Aspartyl/glutamyl-tRNA(Asn/Gln) amidotransferase subunit B; Short=Asp/Glu-ADT subunit B [Methanopyrus kandleri AV19]AAM02173.1 Asp-tRNAAsn/Glu-tRNAGln amidotransferase B subunit (PET112 homolog) [Methanopyrus kandleri AV19]